MPAVVHVTASMVELLAFHSGVPIEIDPATGAVNLTIDDTTYTTTFGATS